MKLFANKEGWSHFILSFLVFGLFFVVVFWVGSFQSYRQNEKLNLFKCPQGYSDVATAEDLKIFIKDYLLKNPNATIDDITSYRYNLLVENNCKEVLDHVANSKNNYQQSVIDDLNGEYTKNIKVYESESGFSFKYPNSFFIFVNPDAPSRLMVLPNSLKENKNEPMSAIIISTSENEDSISALDWLKGPYSGYDISKGYSLRKVDGQEAISVENGDWVVVNTPDNKKRLSIALLTNKNAEPLRKELNDLINSMSFVKVP